MWNMKSKKVCWLPYKNLLCLLHVVSYRLLLKIHVIFQEKNTILESSNKIGKTISIIEQNSIAYWLGTDSVLTNTWTWNSFTSFASHEVNPYKKGKWMWRRWLLLNSHLTFSIFWSSHGLLKVFIFHFFYIYIILLTNTEYFLTALLPFCSLKSLTYLHLDYFLYLLHLFIQFIFSNTKFNTKFWKQTVFFLLHCMTKNIWIFLWVLMSTLMDMIIR